MNCCFHTVVLQNVFTDASVQAAHPHSDAFAAHTSKQLQSVQHNFTQTGIDPKINADLSRFVSPNIHFFTESEDSSDNVFWRTFAHTFPSTAAGQKKQNLTQNVEK